MSRFDIFCCKRKKKIVSSIMLLTMFFVVCLPFTAAVQYDLTYDANGNLVSGDGKYRVYNSFNQLWKVYNGSSDAGTLLQEFSYHPLEERVLVKKTYNSTGSLIETVYYWSKNFVTVVNLSGTYNFTYVYHNGELIAQSVNGVKTFFHNDIKGSVVVVSNASGAVIENTSYSPLGEVLTGGNTTRYEYEGKESDSVIGDTDFNARRYKPDLGIFQQPDGIIPEAANPQNLNRYMFALGNPYLHVDPSGHEIRVENEELAGSSFHVVYVDDLRIGTIIDGSERVEVRHYGSVDIGDGRQIIAGSYNHYDYDVRLDENILNNKNLHQKYCDGSICSLNDITWKNMNDPNNKENIQKSVYLINAALSWISSAPKLAKYALIFSAFKGVHDVAEEDWSGVVQAVLDINPLTSTAMNVILFSTLQGKGRKLGEQHQKAGSYNIGNVKVTPQLRSSYEKIRYYLGQD